MDVEQKVKINKRIWNNILQYCEMIKIDVNSYVSDCLEKQNNIDRYGDLNSLRGANKPEIIKKEEENHYNVEYKAKKVATNEKLNEKSDEKINNEEIVEVKDEPKKKRRRTLKAN